jgi:benzoate-CoA ligase
MGTGTDGNIREYKRMTSTENNLVGKLLDGALERGWGGRVALAEGEREWTYAELRDISARLATGLRSLRVSPGDRVAVFSRDTLEAAAAVLGTIYAGAVAVPVTELGRPTDIRDRLIDCGAVAAIVDADLVETLESVRSETPALQEVIVFGGSGPGQREFRSLIRGSSPADAAEPVATTDPALILYSAGAKAAEVSDESALSRPRGVPHNHEAPLLAAESFARGYLSMGPEDRVLSVVRISTAYGLGAGLIFPLMIGARSLLLPEQPHSKAVFSAVESFEPTVVFATPSLYRSLARDAEARQLERPLAAVRACVSGAEDMPPRVIERVRRFLGTDVIVGYGLTEAFQFVIAGVAGECPAGACGKGVEGFDLRIVGDDGQPVGANEIGTLELSGPTVASGYWGAEEIGEWLMTSDRFMQSEDGHYFHCGRVDDLFKVGGKWVYPGEVERALLAHEAVWECAVVGADDEDGLIKPQAFVVPNIGFDANQELVNTLREYVKSELAPYKYPRWIEFVDELPKGPSGTVLRYKLRDRLKASRAQRRAETAADTPA